MLSRKKKLRLENFVKTRCSTIMNEARSKRVTKQMWKRMDDDARENALLTVIEDPDDRRFDDYMESDWNRLPGWIQRDMMTEQSNIGDLKSMISNLIGSEQPLDNKELYQGLGTDIGLNEPKIGNVEEPNTNLDFSMDSGDHANSTLNSIRNIVKNTINK